MADKTWGEKFPKIQDDGDLKVHISGGTLSSGSIAVTYPATNAPYLVEDVGSRGQMSVWISWEHWMVHKGYMWSGMHLKTGVANDGKYLVHFKTGSEKRVHFLIELIASTKAYVTVYQDATMSDNGTVVEYGPNRIGTSTDFKPELEVFHTPTVSVNGTEMGDILLGGGIKSSPVAGSSRASGAEWELDKNKSYWILMEAKGGAGVSTDFAFEFTAYKEPN